VGNFDEQVRGIYEITNSDGWLEANAHLGPAYRQVVRTLAWQRRATGLVARQL
jgi:hypothetical protein